MTARSLMMDVETFEAFRAPAWSMRVARPIVPLVLEYGRPLEVTSMAEVARVD